MRLKNHIQHENGDKTYLAIFPGNYLAGEVTRTGSGKQGYWTVRSYDDPDEKEYVLMSRALVEWKLRSIIAEKLRGELCRWRPVKAPEQKSSTTYTL